MSIAFYSGNLVDQSEILPSTENLLFPATNIQKTARTKVFRSQGNSTQVVFDFQETSEVDTVFMVDNWKSGFGFISGILEMNATNTWGAPAFSQALASNNSKFGMGLTELDTVQEYRFARLDLTSTLGYCELSKVFIGKKNNVGGRSISFGWTFKDNDLSVIKENRYGQKFVDLITRQREFNISFSNLSKDEIDLIYAIHDENGLSKPFFVKIGCPSMCNELERYSGMVYLKTMPQITNRSFGRYGLSMQLEEAK